MSTQDEPKPLAPPNPKLPLWRPNNASPSGADPFRGIPPEPEPEPDRIEAMLASIREWMNL